MIKNQGSLKAGIIKTYYVLFFFSNIISYIFFFCARHIETIAINTAIIIIVMLIIITITITIILWELLNRNPQTWTSRLSFIDPGISTACKGI